MTKQDSMQKVASFVFITFIAFSFLHTTTNSQEIISPAGNHHEAGNISISWTLGETVVETFKADEIILTQGFHQPALTVVSIDEIDAPGYNITAFPNPTKSFITLNVETEDFENLRFGLYDFNGRLIKHNRLYERHTNVSFEGLEQGVYFIRIIENNKSLTTIKVIKN